MAMSRAVADRDPAVAPASPAGPSPARPPGSVRRTSAIDASWPQGLAQPLQFNGRARDLFSPRDRGPGIVLADDRMRIIASPGREIMTIETSRSNDAAQSLIGIRAGGHLRSALEQALPDEHRRSTPLHLLLDDFCGASLVATWAWSRWDPDWMATKAKSGIPMTAGKAGQMEGICAGFRPGSSALLPNGMSNTRIQSSADVPPLPHPDDPEGWHELAEQTGVAHRRARRLDVWIADGAIQIDAGFQDSAATPVPGQRQAVHEYRVLARASLDDFTLTSIDATPHILPYRECPAAVANVQAMVGRPLSDFRQSVLDRLKGTAGCTHLNDVLRSLADVPALTAALLARQDPG
jgi:hypothetical protein